MISQGPVEFPWNPDADGDDLIGVNDLVSLLSVYNTAFSEEGLYLSADSASAIYYLGKLPYVLCSQGCANLPGAWKIPSSHEIFSMFDGLADTRTGSQNISWHWVKTDFDLGNYTNGPNTSATALCNMQSSNSSPQYVYTLVSEPIRESRGCTCYSQERPKVEYSFCNVKQYANNVDGSDSNVIAFQDCCDSKVQDGWYPLGGLTKGVFNDAGQAFWRWSE